MKRYQNTQWQIVLLSPQDVVTESDFYSIDDIAFWDSGWFSKSAQEEESQ